MMRLLTEFYGTPWAIEPATLASIQSVLERWAFGTKLSPAEIRAAIGDAPEAAAARRAQVAQASGGSVKIIPIYGVLTHRAYAATSVSQSLTSVEALAREFKAAAADPSVSAIVMDIDSPGGSVFGVQELADVLASVRSVKPLVAVANNTAASAAYWLAAQANEVVVTPSGMVGSIGVIVPHADMSAAYEKLGVKKEYITYGKYKAEGNDTGPLDAEARANLQEMVDAYGAAFTKAVSKGRQVPIDTVRGEAFGQGRMKLAADAVASGMADSIGTLEEVVARYSKRRGKSGAMAEREIQIIEA
jgi:signal peptide peptidase SppA